MPLAIIILFTFDGKIQHIIMLCLKKAEIIYCELH